VDRTGGPEAGVPHLAQNPCPSSSGLPQFLQKPAIFASGNLYHVGAAFDSFDRARTAEHGQARRVILLRDGATLRRVGPEPQ
jgi:hypothetical protein